MSPELSNSEKYPPNFEKYSRPLRSMQEDSKVPSEVKKLKKYSLNIRNFEKYAVKSEKIPWTSSSMKLLQSEVHFSDVHKLLEKYNNSKWN